MFSALTQMELMTVLNCRLVLVVGEKTMLFCSGTNDVVADEMGQAACQHYTSGMFPHAIVTVHEPTMVPVLGSSARRWPKAARVSTSASSRGHCKSKRVILSLNELISTAMAHFIRGRYIPRCSTEVCAVGLDAAAGAGPAGKHADRRTDA